MQKSLRSRVGGAVTSRGRIIFTAKKPLVELRQLLLWIGLTLALGIIAVWVMSAIKEWDPLAGTAATNPSIWEVFFAVFGLMYAIIVGLFLVEAYRRWRELSFTIQSEINAMGDIHDCLRYFDNDKKNLRAKEEITDSLRLYVKTMEADWASMKNPRENKLIQRFQEKGVRPIFRNWMKTSRKEYRIEQFKDEGVRPIIEYVNKLEPNTDKDRHALEVVIDRISEITTHRANRLQMAVHGLTLPLYVLIVFMSVVIVGATLLLDVPNDWVHGFIVFSTTVALVALGLLLTDMDHPFTGFWRIWKDPLNDVEEKLSKERRPGMTESS